MTSQDGTTSPNSPASPVNITRVRSPEQVASRRPYSDFNIPFRRSSASLQSLFVSSATSVARKHASTSSAPGFTSGLLGESGVLPAPESTQPSLFRDNIVRAFAPRVSLLSSQDVGDLLEGKGLKGGLLELLRPYGEEVPGKVTIRDSVGSSRTWDDFAVRFANWRDGFEEAALKDISSERKPSTETKSFGTAGSTRADERITPIEENVAQHISFFESRATDPDEEQSGTEEPAATSANRFHVLYLRRLLSGLPITTHETFAHPVACAIAVSSKNKDPIEEFRQMHASTLHGTRVPPPFVSNDFLRYYILIHDEDRDDIQTSQGYFEQMKRHFGLHCHLLRIRGSQCVPSDDDAVRIQPCHWLTAAEELTEIRRRENLDEVEAIGPCLYESDEASVKALVREMVTQSVIPVMERSSATWNNEVVSRRKGISGRFISLSKRWTSFGSSRNSSSAGGTSSNSNYDSISNYYRSDAPEAIMRRLADYSVMLRDYKLAHSVYDLIRSDFNHDKAWQHVAGASEMTAITALLVGLPLSSKRSSDSIDALLETAVYNYQTRCEAPLNPIRCMLVAVELLDLRGGATADETAKWASKIIESESIGPIGAALLYERIASAFASRKGIGNCAWGSRSRKAALWKLMATQAWLELGFVRMAKRSLTQVFKLYKHEAAEHQGISFTDILTHLSYLKEEISQRVTETEAFDAENIEALDEDIEAMQDVETEQLGSGVAETLSSRAVTDEVPEHPLADDKASVRVPRKSLIGIQEAPSISSQPRESKN